MKRLARISIITLAILVLLYLVMIMYVSLNKDGLIKQVNEEISSRLSGKVTIKDIKLSFFRHFPEASVLLKDVEVIDTLFNEHRRPLLKAENIFATISIGRLVRKQPSINGLHIKNGVIHIFTDSGGYTNKYLFRTNNTGKTGKSGKQKNRLRSIEVENVRFTYEDRQKRKFHDMLVNDLKTKIDEYGGGSLIMTTDSRLHINRLSFNTTRGSYLRNQSFQSAFSCLYDPNRSRLEFHDMKLSVGQNDFLLDCVFNFMQDPHFTLALQTKQIYYERVKALLPEKVAASLSIVSLSAPLDVQANVKGSLKGGPPLVEAKCSTVKAVFKTPFFDFDNVSFSGRYTNELAKNGIRHDSNSLIELRNFSAEWNGLPVRASGIHIINLKVPRMSCDLASTFALSKLNDIIGNNSFRLKDGACNILLGYTGPLVRNSNTNSLINGSINFSNGSLIYVPRDAAIDNVSGTIDIRNSNVLFRSIECTMFNNKIRMNGKADNLLTLVNDAPDKAKLEWNIYAPVLNLQPFTALLQARKKIRSEAPRSQRLKMISSKIDDLLEKSAIDLKLNAGQLNYKKFGGRQTKLDLSLKEDTYHINHASMQHAGGTLQLTGALIGRTEGHTEARLEARMSDMNVTEVFDAFDNFGQDGISARNLGGLLSAAVNASMFLDKNGKILPSSIVSKIDFSLRDGALYNFDPVKKLQRFIFKKRDFDTIRFAELKDRFEVMNSDIKINRMEIQSTVMSMFVEGIYSMRGKTDMSIQVPLSNIKKRGDDYNPENIGVDKKAGSSIFIRGRPGPDGKIKFALDLFKKYKKENKK